MNIISGRNVHQILPKAIQLLLQRGKRRPSRNGEVLALDGVSVIEYERPQERVMFWPLRDANPFFHLCEALWMLAGRQDVEYVAQFVKRMRNFSDNGATFNAAYGYRWRKKFGIDQLNTIAFALKQNPSCRRQVLAMWGANYDLACDSKDLPCNCTATFQINSEGALDMTVFNRSNDLFMGALGANAVHFSFLMEYMASRVGVPIGTYYQVSANLHGYVSDVNRFAGLVSEIGCACPYELGRAVPLPFAAGRQFEDDLSHLDTHNWTYESFWMSAVYTPLMEAFQRHKAKDDASAMRNAMSIGALDWRKACVEWLQRRMLRKAGDFDPTHPNYEKQNT